MASEKVKNLNLSFQARHFSRRGPTVADSWNDSVDELAKDLSALSHQWNDRLVKLLSSIPNGEKNSAINAYINGIDGANL